MDGNIEILQIGSPNDSLLEGVKDLRGKTSIRKTAAILSQSKCFVGTVGFLMHLARSVECRSVIIYGGREHSWQSGYKCNENLNSFVDCAPCWKWNDCNHNRKCMDSITPEEVLKAIREVLAKNGTVLELERTVI
jgi:ADP-heptose:LPS heptosyltransferase